ncbi:MAG: YIP1 family protein [Candidatus Melainabacteria bacterium]|nr:YIP1 family protein [Candidatus Melainabacteria bacterium]
MADKQEEEKSKQEATKSGTGQAPVQANSSGVSEDVESSGRHPDLFAGLNYKPSEIDACAWPGQKAPSSSSSSSSSGSPGSSDSSSNPNNSANAGYSAGESLASPRQGETGQPYANQGLSLAEEVIKHALAGEFTSPVKIERAEPQWPQGELKRKNGDTDNAAKPEARQPENQNDKKADDGAPSYRPLEFKPEDSSNFPKLQLPPLPTKSEPRRELSPAPYVRRNETVGQESSFNSPMPTSEEIAAMNEASRTFERTAANTNAAQKSSLDPNWGPKPGQTNNKLNALNDLNALKKEDLPEQAQPIKRTDLRPPGSDREKFAREYEEALNRAKQNNQAPEPIRKKQESALNEALKKAPEKEVSRGAAALRRAGITERKEDDGKDYSEAARIGRGDVFGIAALNIMIARNVLKDPRDFFDRLPLDGSNAEPIFFLLSIEFATALLRCLFKFSLFPLFGELTFGLVSTLVGACLVNFVFERIFGKGDFNGVLRVLCYSRAPILISFIALGKFEIGLYVSLFWTLYLNYVGLSRVFLKSQAVIVIVVLVMGFLGAMVRQGAP